jgi:hypothetical protein
MNARIILKFILKNCGAMVLNEFAWLRKGAGGRIL